MQPAATHRIELLTPEDLTAQLAAAVRSRRLPDHFLYVGRTGATNWLDLSRSDDFPIAARLTDLLRRSLDDVARSAPAGSTLIGIGVGDGSKERMVLDALVPRGLVDRYIAIDISSGLVDEAVRNASGAGAETTGVVALCEDLARLRRYWQPPAVICLLGNNFCNYVAPDLLATVHAQMAPGDLFIFDCHLCPEDEAARAAWAAGVERAYQSPQNAAFNLAPLVEHGLAPDAARFELSLVAEDSPEGPVYRTRKRITILRDSVLTFGPQTVALAEGDALSMGFTYKYTAAQVRAAVARSRLACLAERRSDDGDNLLLIITRS